MNTIQALRQRREEAATEAQRLISENPGSRFTPAVEQRVNALLNEVEDLDRTLRNRQRAAEGAVGGQPAAGTAWRNANTGEAVRVVNAQDAGRVAEVMGATTAPSEAIGLADFFRGVAGMRTTDAVRAALSVGTDGSGGYTVPTVVLPQFIEALIPASTVLQAGAQIMPLDRSAKTFRFAKLSTVPTAAWRAEAGNVSESDPAFGVVDITPKSLAFFFKCSRELLADSVNIDQMLQSAIAGAFSTALDGAALRGTGANTPTGINGVSGVGSVTNGGAGATQSSLRWSNLLSAVQTILEANGPMPTAAIMSPRSLVGYASLADSTYQPLQRPALLNDVKFLATSQIPNNLTVGASTDCTEVYVGDYSEMVIGLREDVSVMRADQLYAGTGQIAFFCHVRADIAPLRAAAFCKISGIRAN